MTEGEEMMSDMPEIAWLTPRGSGTISGVYVDMPLGDEPRGEHKYLRAYTHTTDLAKKDKAIADLLDGLKMVDAWGNGLRHKTAHESKMVKTARALINKYKV